MEVLPIDHAHPIVRHSSCCPLLGSDVTALILARFYIFTSRRPTTGGSWYGKLTGGFPIHILGLVLWIVNSA
jgi:hypothetical protein